VVRSRLLAREVFREEGGGTERGGFGHGNPLMFVRRWKKDPNGGGKKTAGQDPKPAREIKHKQTLHRARKGKRLVAHFLNREDNSRMPIK